MCARQGHYARDAKILADFPAAVISLGTLSVVVIGSHYKNRFGKGGSAVAELLGRRLVTPNTTHPDERKLQNVIEEIPIASGVPVPKIYVLDNEEGINAFAAGHSPSDAAIGVTRDCMTWLSRDELQGVPPGETDFLRVAPLNDLPRNAR